MKHCSKLRWRPVKMDDNDEALEALEVLIALKIFPRHSPPAFAQICSRHWLNIPMCPRHPSNISMYSRQVPNILFCPGICSNISKLSPTTVKLSDQSQLLVKHQRIKNPEQTTKYYSHIRGQDITPSICSHVSIGPRHLMKPSICPHHLSKQL